MLLVQIKHNIVTALTTQFSSRQMYLKSVALQESKGSATAEGGEKQILFFVFRLTANFKGRFTEITRHHGARVCFRQRAFGELWV